MKKSFMKTTLLLCCYCIGISTFAQTKADYVPCQEMPELITNFNADSRALIRFYTPASENNFRYGGNSGSGGSPEKRERLNNLYVAYEKKLDAINFDALSQECKVDYLLFKRNLKENLRLAAEEAAEYEKIRKWFPFADQIYALEKSRRRGIQPEAEKVAGDWYRITKQVKELQVKLGNDKDLTISSLYAAEQVIDHLKKSLSSVFKFYNGYDPMFTWWTPKSYQKLDEALTAYAAQFKSKVSSFAKTDKSGIVGQPVGAAELIRQLQYEMISYTPEELIAIAQKEFAWCDQEMLKASKEMGFGNDWKAALEKVKQTYVPAGKQPEAILKLYNESIDFLKKNDLITIPPLAEETWGMGMMSPERQLVNPFFTGGTEITISYPTHTMDEDQKLMSMRGNNPHFSRATVHHELIAGHNLQGFMNARNRTYRNFETPFWTEGWALYWELLLWDKEFPQGPEDKIGMLFWHMHRCARIIFSLNYHTGKWTPQQCIDFLVDRVGHERANAEGEVRRSFEGNYPELYQLAYLTGGRQFYALKNELVGTGKLSYKQYHDAVMRLNAMPVEMIRAVLINQPLTKDFKTTWRFYDHMQ